MNLQTMEWGLGDIALTCTTGSLICIQSEVGLKSKSNRADLVLLGFLSPCKHFFNWIVALYRKRVFIIEGRVWCFCWSSINVCCSCCKYKKVVNVNVVIVVQKIWVHGSVWITPIVLFRMCEKQEIQKIHWSNTCTCIYMYLNVSIIAFFVWV